MSWIEGVGPADLPDIFQVLSLNPDALDTVKQLNETLSFGNSPLGRVREEAIATVVAVANRCRFGALTHGGFLRQYTGDQETAANMLVNHHLAGLDPADRQMLDFAIQVTVNPSSLTRDDIEGLRRVGFDDHEILSIVLITCLVNFMNRLADSLGIDVPPGYHNVVEKWLTGPAGRQTWLMRPISQRTRDPSERPLPGGLGRNGWGGSPDWHHSDGGGLNGLGSRQFGGYDGLASESARQEVKPSDLHLNGSAPNDLEYKSAEDELRELIALKDVLTGEITGGAPEDLVQEDLPNEDPRQEGQAELGEPQILLDFADDSGDTGLTPGEEDRFDMKSQLGASPDPGVPAVSEVSVVGAPPENTGVLPPAETDETTYAITTTPVDNPEYPIELELERALVEAEGEEEVFVTDPNNPVVRFVGDTCVVSDGEVTSARDLYIAYLRWCDENIEPPMPQRGFGMILTQMGFNRRRRGRGRNWSWWGVRLSLGKTSGDVGGEDDYPNADYPDGPDDEE